MNQLGYAPKWATILLNFQLERSSIGSNIHCFILVSIIIEENASMKYLFPLIWLHFNERDASGVYRPVINLRLSA
jgi:hypothetical protein